MFSIFGKRKPAETPTEDQPIQGPAEGSRPGTSGDDFVFIERRPGPDAPPPSAASISGAMYPPMPPVGYLPYPPMPGARGGGPGAGAGAAMKLPGAQGPVNYLQDIPFELAPAWLARIAMPAPRCRWTASWRSSHARCPWTSWPRSTRSPWRDPCRTSATNISP